jgi:hypothetical protein
MLRNSMLRIAIALFAWAALAVAGDQTAPKATKLTKAEHGKHASFEGTLVCLGCSLKKSDGARAQCSDFGHTHALKTEDGRYVNLLPNRYSAELLNGGELHNKELAVKGVYFAHANQLDVEAYSVEGKKHAWCDHCKRMDGCVFAKGDSEE